MMVACRFSSEEGILAFLFTHEGDPHLCLDCPGHLVADKAEAMQKRVEDDELTCCWKYRLITPGLAALRVSALGSPMP